MLKLGFVELIAQFTFFDLENLFTKLGQLILSNSGSMRNLEGVKSGIHEPYCYI